MTFEKFREMSPISDFRQMVPVAASYTNRQLIHRFKPTDVFTSNHMYNANVE